MRLIDADNLIVTDRSITTVAGNEIHLNYVEFRHIEEAPTIEAIPVEFIKDLYKQAIEYRDRRRWMSSAWNRANEHAIGIDSILQVWEDRQG